MEDALERQRYHRQNIQSRRRKRNVRENGAILRKIFRQVVLSALILIIIGVIKNINTPATNYILNGVKGALTQNIEIGSIYKSIDGFLGKLTKDKASEKSDVPTNGVSESENSDILPMDDTEGGGSIDYSSYYLEQQTQQIQSVVQNSNSTGSSPETAGIADRGTPVVKNNTVQTVTNQSTSKQNNSFIVPVKGILSSAFGSRTSPTSKSKEYHKGIDVAADMSTSIKAALDGEVIESGLLGTFGYCIKIKHANGMTTLYAHCSKLIAKKGQKVKKGDIIAKVGSTGASTGPHLHFEVWKNGTPVNPLNYIKVPS